jgi:3'-phosphoadenosine 5'-phosphosulfate sulfotransferase
MCIKKRKKEEEEWDVYRLKLMEKYIEIDRMKCEYKNIIKTEIYEVIKNKTYKHELKEIYEGVERTMDYIRCIEKN